MMRITKGASLLVIVVMVCMLASCGSNAGNSGIPENPGNVYRVIVQDESGAGVKGAKVQFCSDVQCTLGETDENGIASFKDFDEGSYTVHVLTVPEGFAEDKSEYEAPKTYGDVTITLKAA